MREPQILRRNKIKLERLTGGKGQEVQRTRENGLVNIKKKGTFHSHTHLPPTSGELVDLSQYFLKAEANQMLGKQESGREVISINNMPEWKDDILFTSRTCDKISPGPNSPWLLYGYSIILADRLFLTIFGERSDKRLLLACCLNSCFYIL